MKTLILFIGLVVFGIFLSTGFDRDGFSKISSLLEGVASKVPFVSKNQNNSEKNNALRVAADAIIANEKNHDLDIKLKCPIRGKYLDGTDSGELAHEIFKIVRKSSGIKTKDGWGPVTMTEVKIFSNGAAYDAHLIGSGASHAVVAYSSRVTDSVSSNVFVATYIFDLAQKKMSRSIASFFQEDAERAVAQCTTEGK